MTVLSPWVSSSMPYSCGDFETFWEPSYDGEETFAQFSISAEDADRIRQTLRDLRYGEVAGGYYPIYKFYLDGDVYCVTPFADVLKNDSLLTNSQALYDLLEDRVDVSSRTWGSGLK